MDPCLAKVDGIEYRRGADFTVEAMMAVYARSGLGARRPMDRPDLFAAMRENSGFFITAWADGRLVGLSRNLTDGVWVCYLADLLVDAAFQRRGIGKRLLAFTMAEVPRAKLVLLAAPGADDYYRRLGFTPDEHAWTRLDQGQMDPPSPEEKRGLE